MLKGKFDRQYRDVQGVNSIDNIKMLKDKFDRQYKDVTG